MTLKNIRPKTLQILSALRALMSTRGTSPFRPNEMQSKKLIYPSATRNQGPILEVLLDQMPKYFGADEKLFLLEIASGSGQHAAHFAPKLPNVTFQPTEYSADVLASISMYANECPSRNILPPLQFDVRNDFGYLNLAKNSIDIIYCCNMIHISPIACTVSLFKNAGEYLRPGGLLITYGAYAADGVISPQSNVEFDKSLRFQNPEWGIRCLTQLSQMASSRGVILKNVFDLPANNKCVVWRKE